MLTFMLTSTLGLFMMFAGFILLLHMVTSKGIFKYNIYPTAITWAIGIALLCISAYTMPLANVTTVQHKSIVIQTDKRITTENGQTCYEMDTPTYHIVWCKVVEIKK